MSTLRIDPFNRWCEIEYLHEYLVGAIVRSYQIQTILRVILIWQLVLIPFYGRSETKSGCGEAWTTVLRARGDVAVGSS